MSNLAMILLLVLLLTVIGTAMLVFVTVKYYWGERGKPPIVGEERLKQREEELRLRAHQIEWARNNPNKDRNPSFWNNRKVQ